MPPSSPAHSYRECPWCGRSFKAYRSWGQTRGFFCTWICRGKARYLKCSLRFFEKGKALVKKEVPGVYQLTSLEAKGGCTGGLNSLSPPPPLALLHPGGSLRIGSLVAMGWSGKRGFILA
jgi:hypothetical protein